MSEEKVKILEMIQQGKITATEGLDLLEALDGPETVQTGSVPRVGDRFLRVRVNGDKAKVNVNIPLSLLKATSKLAALSMNYIPEEARNEMEKKGIDLANIDLEELVSLIDQGLVDGKLVDVDAEDPKHGKTRVEVYVD